MYWSRYSFRRARKSSRPAAPASSRERALDILRRAAGQPERAFVAATTEDLVSIYAAIAGIISCL